MGLLVDALAGDATLPGWFVFFLLFLAALAGALIVAGAQEDRRPLPGQQRPNERPIVAPQQRRPGPIEQHRRMQEEHARRQGPPRMSEQPPPRVSWMWRDVLSAGLLDGARID